MIFIVHSNPNHSKIFGLDIHSEKWDCKRRGENRYICMLSPFYGTFFFFFNDKILAKRSKYFVDSLFLSPPIYL